MNIQPLRKLSLKRELVPGTAEGYKREPTVPLELVNYWSTAPYNQSPHLRAECVPRAGN